MKSPHLFLIPLSLFVVSFSACQLPSNETETTSPVSTITEEAATPEETAAAPETTTLPETTNLAFEEVKLDDVVNTIESFALASDPNYARCVKQSASSCESQAVSLKIQESGNASDCKLLSDEYARSACSDNASATKALQDKNINLCDSIAESYRMNQCKTDVLRMQARENLDESYCNKIADIYKTEKVPDDSVASIPDVASYMSENYVKQCKNDIILQDAQNKGDEKICDKIKDESIKQMCVSTVSYAQSSKAFESAVDATNSDTDTSRSVPKN